MSSITATKISVDYAVLQNVELLVSDALGDALVDLGQRGVAAIRSELPQSWLLCEAAGYEIEKNENDGYFLAAGIRSGFERRKNGDPAKYGVNYERGFRRGKTIYRRKFLASARAKILNDVDRVVAENLKAKLESIR